MSVFSSIGHAVASFFLGVYDSLSGKPTANASVAVQVGAAAGALLGIADPQATAFVNAAVTGYGDIVQAVKATGANLKAGDKLTLVVSDALAAASTTVWPDIEKLLAAFEGAIKPQTAGGAAG
jgi:hypothetical protein